MGKSTNKSWGGRFKTPTAGGAQAFTASIGFDIRLYPYDVRVSIAHAKMLAHCGIITAAGGGNELGVRFAGPPFRSKTPLLTLKGGEKGHELQLEFPDPSLELQQAYHVRVSLVGKYYQRPSGT